MDIGIGYGGWVRVANIEALPTGALAYVRFQRDEAVGRLVAVELYIESVTGERLRGEHLRRLPLDLIEAVANEDGGHDVEVGFDHPGPLLGVLASNFATPAPNREYLSGPRRGEPKPLNWVELSMWSQIRDSGVPVARRGDNGMRRERVDVPPLAPPPDGRYTDQWWRHLAAAYQQAVTHWRRGGGEAPAKALAEQAGVSVHTVRSWVYRARKAGFLPKGEQGKVG